MTNLFIKCAWMLGSSEVSGEIVFDLAYLRVGFLHDINHVVSMT